MVSQGDLISGILLSCCFVFAVKAEFVASDHHQTGGVSLYACERTN